MPKVSSEVDLSINGLPCPPSPLQNLGSRVPGRGTHMVNCAATLAKPIMRRDPPNFLNSYISVPSCHFSGLNYLVQMVRFCCYILHIFSFEDKATACAPLNTQPRFLRPPQAIDERHDISQSDDISVVTSHGPSFPQFPFLVAFKQAVSPPVDVCYSKELI